MNQKEAIAYFEGWHLSPNAEDLYVNVRVNVGKMRAAIAAMTCPWVRTSDRLPDKCDYYTMYLTTKKRNGGVWQVRGIFIKEHPELCPWWMPIPTLPELEEQGGHHA